MTTQADADVERGHVVEVEGVQVHYRVQGAGEPLILLHGGTLSGDMWKPYLGAFAEQHRVITPDLRGYGRTDNPTGAMSYRQLAGEAVAFMRAIGVERPAIVGFSDGGQVALEIGMRHPEAARALVLAGVWFKFGAQYQAWLRSAVGDGAAPVADGAALADNHPDWAAWLDQIYGPGGWKPLLNHFKPMWSTPLSYGSDDFARAVAPTLVLIGDRDELVPVEESVEMYRLLPDAELAVVSGASHGAFLAGKVAASQALMLEFLTRRGASAG